MVVLYYECDLCFNIAIIPNSYIKHHRNINRENAVINPIAYRKKSVGRVYKVAKFTHPSEFRENLIVGAISSIPRWAKACNIGN